MSAFFLSARIKLALAWRYLNSFALSLPALLVLAGLGYGGAVLWGHLARPAPPLALPAEVPAGAGGAVLTAAVHAGPLAFLGGGPEVYWEVAPELAWHSGGNVLHVWARDGTRPGKYLVRARAIVAGKPACARTLVSVGAVPPGPNPPNPEPTDPLFGPLKAAWQADPPADQPKAATLAAIYRDAVTNAVPKAKTPAALIAAMHAGAQAGIGDALPKVRRVLANELNKQVPANDLMVMDGDLSAKYAAQFTRFATLLEALK